MNLMDWLLILSGIVLLALKCGRFVPEYTGIVILNRFTGKMRSRGSGLRWLLPWEKIVRITSLEKKTHSFEATFEAKDESPITLRTNIDEVAHDLHLVDYLSFNDEDRIKSIIERLKSILTIEIRKKKNRDEVMDNLGLIAKTAKETFENALSESGRPLQEYYGVNLKALVIADKDLPKALQDAQVEREAMEKKNETRALEMKTLKKLASEFVKEAERRGEKMSFENALTAVQLQFGDNVKKEIRLYGIEKGTLMGIKEVFDDR